MSNFLIIGNGVAGQLAAKFFERYKPRIVSIGGRSDVGVFRSKTAEIPLVLGVPAHEVKVRKAVLVRDGSDFHLLEKATIGDVNEYSLKVANAITGRSINSVGDGDDIRYVFELPRKVDINSPLTKIVRKGLCKIGTGNFAGAYLEQSFEYDVIINTIPMPEICEICGIVSGMDFEYKPIKVFRKVLGVKMNASVQQTLYYPSSDSGVYRATLQSNKDGFAEIIVEVILDGYDDNFHEVYPIIVKAFGLDCFYRSYTELENCELKYGKIFGGKGNIGRKRVMLRLTNDYNIYSLGRYACWNESTKTEDLLSDLRKIESMMRMGDDEREYFAKMEGSLE